MIIVMPDGSNRFGGSFYTNSYTTGNWEDFIVYELPEYIDANYRSIPKSESRGIAGHSMGGYGALKIAMKHPDIFSSVYGHCSCCLTLSPSYWDENAINEAMSIDSWEAMLQASWWVKLLHAFSAATSSNPNNPPFYSDLPYDLEGDSILISENAKAKWSANIPSYMADQYISNLNLLRAIALDGGKTDSWTTGSQYFSDLLTRIKVKNSLEIYEGGHNDKLNERFYNNILPFFSEMLIKEDL
jgi:S-formylglutathione hydrolase FrmB